MKNLNIKRACLSEKRSRPAEILRLRLRMTRFFRHVERSETSRRDINLRFSDKHVKRVGFVFYLLLIPLALSAEESSHPKTLSELMAEALNNNQEIVESSTSLAAAKANSAQARSTFYPELGVEAGWEDLRSKEETLNGSFTYGYARYNLFNGNKDNYKLQVRSKEQEFAAFALEKTKARISRLVAAEFYKLLFFDEVIRLKQQAISVNETQLKKAKKRVQAGITTKTDILEFEFRSTALQSDLVLLYQEKKASEKELWKLLGRKDSAKQISVSGNLAPNAFSDNADSLFNRALAERFELREAEKDLTIATLEYQASKAIWSPKIDLEADYGILQPSDREIEGKPSSAVLLKLSLPLFSGFDSYYERMARISQREQSHVRMNRLKVETKNQIDTTLEHINAINTRIAIEQRNVTRAKEYLDLTTAEYNRGIKNSPDYAGAAERLFDANLRILELQKEFQLARLLLAETIGVGADF